MSVQIAETASKRTWRLPNVRGWLAEAFDWFSFHFLEWRHDKKLAEQMERIKNDPETEWVPWEQVKKDLDL